MTVQSNIYYVTVLQGEMTVTMSLVLLFSLSTSVQKYRSKMFNKLRSESKIRIDDNITTLQQLFIEN